MLKQMLYQGLIGKSVMKPFRPIQAIAAAAIAGDVANHIESIPCSVQTTDLLFPSIPNTTAINKAITRSSGQSHLTHPEHESSVLKTVTKPDDPTHPEVVTHQLKNQLNPKCMTKLDWVELNLKIKPLVKSFDCSKQKSYIVKKEMKLTTMR